MNAHERQVYEMGRSAGVEWILGRLLSDLRNAGIASEDITDFTMAIENVAKPAGHNGEDAETYCKGVTQAIADIEGYSNR